jgi:pyoluteorin transport system permease protein
MLAAIFRIVALVRKELLAMLKDPRGRAVLFVPPCYNVSCSGTS